MTDQKGKKVSNYDRVDDDFYVDEEWVTEALVATLNLTGLVYDPACGKGNVLRACRKFGLKPIGSDLHDRGTGFTGIDFLKSRYLPGRAADKIICNPPYSILDDWIERCLSFGHVHLVALVVPLGRLQSGRRYKRIYRRTPPNVVYVLLRRPSMPPGNKPTVKPKGGKVPYMWLFWQRPYPPAGTDPVVRWLQ